MSRMLKKMLNSDSFSNRKDKQEQIIVSGEYIIVVITDFSYPVSLVLCSKITKYLVL